ncbi:MAG: hypothetical protein DRI56_11225 [Chloroflexota bacterium]|nr:MAG: hypothetical protein DRI56_11225 [Chloroflexota bacterium]
MTHPNNVKIEIANLVVSLSCHPPSLHKHLRKRYHKFLTEDKAQIEAHIELSGKERPNALLEPKTTFNKDTVRFTSPGFQGEIDLKTKKAQLRLSSATPIEEIDYLIRVIYAVLAFESGGLLFHSAGIVRDGQSFLFFGHSGSGKTTVSRLSPQYLTLNDDLLILMPQGDGWQAHGTPFWNPSQTRPSAQHAPLAGLFRLVQDKNVHLEKISKGQALAELIGNIPIIPLSAPRNLPLLHRLETLIDAIPIYHLHFLPDDSFWQIIQKQFNIS